MKITLISAALLCASTFYSNAQSDEPFQQDLSFTSNFQPLERTVGKDSLKIHPGTLNYFFKNQLNSVAFSSEDLSLQRYFATVTNEDNAFSFGLQFNNLGTWRKGVEKSKDTKFTWMLALGLGAKSVGSFATFFETSKGEVLPKTEINGKVKFTWVGRGIITRYTSQRLINERYNKEYLGVKYDKKFTKFKKEDGEVEDEIRKQEALNGSDNLTDTEREEIVKDYYDKLKSEFMEEEAKAIITNKLYRKMWDHWATFEATLPLSKKQYKRSDSIQQASYSKNNFYGWGFNLNYTSMWKSSENNAVYLSGRFRAFNNNNIMTEDISSADFLSVVNQSSSQTAVTETNKVYIGEFDQFVNFGLAAEVIWYPFNKYVGMSWSVEQMFSSTNHINWKIGIPFSLKDKEGKPKVNLELQWKEINQKHLLGINVGFVLGKFVGK